MLHSLSFLIRWISWLGIEESTLSMRWPPRLRSIGFPDFAAGFAITISGLLPEVGVDVRVVLALDGGPEGTKGWAEIVAHVIAGVLEVEAVPVVPFDSTRERAGRLAVTACKGPLGV